MNRDLNASRVLALAALVAGVLAGCGRKEQAPAPAPAPAAAPAPAPAAPAGAIIAPAPATVPTDAQRSTGATIAANGVSGANGAAGAPACNSCHGAHGEGNAAGGFPRIAGQTHTYLLHELQAYADGSRKNPIMQPIASALSADQRIAAAAYFASLNPDGTGAPNSAATTPTTSAGAASSPGVNGGTNASNAAAGTANAGSGGARSGGNSRPGGTAPTGRAAVLAMVGDNTKGVQACANCHGPGGAGSGEIYPYLAGQAPNYLTAALGAWRDGSRNDDPSGQMPIIAKGLAPEDISALAAYYAGQPPRALALDAERMTAIGPLATANPPAITSGPQQAQPGGQGSAPGAGTGTEQGSPVTGGSQGAGGGGGTGAAATGAPQSGTGNTGGTTR